MRKLTYILSSITLLGVIVFGTFSILSGNVQAARTKANISPHEFNYQEEVSSLPDPVVVHQTKDITQLATEEINTFSQGAGAFVETDSDVLFMVEQFSERYAQSVLVDEPSWILIKAERYLPNSNVALADGTLLPERYVEETWFNVNSKGQVTEALYRTLHEDGSLLRQSYKNIGQEAERENTELYPIALDYGALLRVRNALEFDSEIIGWVENEDGSEKYTVTLTDYYDNPTQFAGHSVNTSSLQAKLIFDMKSGQLLNMELVHFYESGESVVVDTVSILDIQMMTPNMLPTEIQQALSQN